MKQTKNPFLPLNEYIADGEAHVFGDRVYLFGSHDKENGDTYCMLDYVFYSASVYDLSEWSTKGVSYSAKQDPQYGEKLKYMYAPDVVQGTDGRFYLYYCMSGEKGAGGYGQQISVAVCDTPDGKYEYYGYVRFPDGRPMKEYVTFDPAVMNDKGTIRLYYGTWYPFHEQAKFLAPIFHRVESNMFEKTVAEIKEYKEGVMGPIHVELEDDMLTIKTKPVRILPFYVKGTDFEEHPFFEASSIRKVGDKYYFVYSSMKGHELCYATSDYPDKGFVYGGTIVSNGDVGLHGRKEKDRLNTTGTNHGCIENVNGKWYVFYHRNTNKTAYSRQACVEPIEIQADGRIVQVEITTQGADGNPLVAKGVYPAGLCCNLTNGKMPHQGNGILKKQIPYIAENGVVMMTNGSKAVYKYFSFEEEKEVLRLRVQAMGKGIISVYSSKQEKAIGVFEVEKTNGWKDVQETFQFPLGVQELSFVYHGNDSVKIQEFELK